MKLAAPVFFLSTRKMLKIKSCKMLHAVWNRPLNELVSGANLQLIIDRSEVEVATSILIRKLLDFRTSRIKVP